MDAYKEKEATAADDNILSLSDLQMDEEVNSTNNIFYQDFFGVSGEHWSRQMSNDNSPVKQPMTTDDNVTKPGTKIDQETNPMFRSNSGSFRYMRFKIGSSSTTGSWRSRSLSVMASKSKSRWQVFMSGFGSGRFPAKMDLRDIKTRQLYAQSTTTRTTKVCEDVDDQQVGPEESGGRRRTGGKKAVWWRLVDVLGCRGGYERKNMVVV